MLKKIIFSLFVLVFSLGIQAESVMNQASMEQIIKLMSTTSKGEKGVVEFVYKDVRMYVISDVAHDRMRIVAPTAEYAKLSREQIDAVLESNYHKALDARYALTDGILYSVFIHPLSPLDEAQIKSAVSQVAILAITFGTEYTSGLLDFGENKSITDKNIQPQ